MEHHPDHEPMRGYRRDHASEAMRIIDRCLAEESIVLDGLMQRVLQNGGIDSDGMEARIAAFHQTFKLQEPATPSQF